VRTWRGVYGQPDATGNGPLAPFLGDPSRFKRPFDDGGMFWYLTVEQNGLPWYLLIAGELQPDGTRRQIYDWENVAQRNAQGNALARKLFHDIERRNADALGLDADITRVLQVPTTSVGGVFSVDPIQEAARTGYPFRTPPYVPPDTRLHIYESTFAGAAQKGISPDPALLYARDLGIATPVSAVGVSRAQLLRFVIPGKDGQPPFYLYGIGNTWLRIAYIHGFPGTVIGGDRWIPEAIQTLINVGKIVIGVYTGNVGLVVSSAADIVQTWYNYSEQLAREAATARRVGQRLEGGPTRQRLPTVGELAQQNQQQQRQSGALLAAAAVGAALLFL
jgi:hypothetical protein